MGGRGRTGGVPVFILLWSSCTSAASLGGVVEAPDPVTGSGNAATERGESRVPGWRPTLLLNNRSGDHVALRLNGRRIATATAGLNCIRIPPIVGAVLLELTTVGGRHLDSVTLHLEEATYWRAELRVGSSRSYELWSLEQADPRCAA